MLRFGMAKRDITPREGMTIPGYFEKRFVDDIFDRLYAKAMVLENDGKIAVHAICDTINLRRDDVLRIRRGIFENTGIEEKYISVSASHTHTGGPSWYWFDAAEHDPMYINILVDAAVEAATEAYKKLQPAKIGFTKCEVEGCSFIRRFLMKNGRVKTNPGILNPDIVKPMGTPDLSFVVGKVADENGKPLAFLTNYGVHLDTLGGIPESGKVSADYPGYLAELVEEKYGKGVESFFFTGPCGNTNHINATQMPVELKIDKVSPELPIYKKIAHTLFDALCEVEGKIVLSGDVVPETSRELLSASVRRPTREYVETAHRFLAGEDVVFSGYSMEHLPLRARRLIAMATLDAEKNEIKMIDVEIKTLTLGDTAIVSWPAEVFVEYGKAVREHFKDKNVIIAELSNGSFGCYLPTEDAIEQGGYEPTITGPVTPEPKIGNDMVRETIKLLEKSF